MSNIALSSMPKIWVLRIPLCPQKKHCLIMWPESKELREEKPRLCVSVNHLTIRSDGDFRPWVFSGPNPIHENQCLHLEAKVTKWLICWRKTTWVSLSHQPLFECSQAETGAWNHLSPDKGVREATGSPCAMLTVMLALSCTAASTGCWTWK